MTDSREVVDMTNTETPQRVAIARGQATSISSIERYMPANYEAFAAGPDVIIVGHDNAGWTLDDYVIPRLASGLYHAEELHPTHERM